MSEKELGARLRKAVGSGDFKAVHRLIKGGIDVNARYWYSSTLLHEAVGLGNMEIVRVLLQASADVNATNDDLRTPLHLVARTGNLDIAQELIRHGAFLDCRTRDGKTCLHVALWRGNTEMAALLVNHGANVNIPDNDGWTPLYWASRFNYLDSVRLLIHHGAQLSRQVKNGWTALHVALHYGHLDIVQLLILEGADVNVCAKTESVTTLLGMNDHLSRETIVRVLDMLQMAGYNPWRDSCLRQPQPSASGSQTRLQKDSIRVNEVISEWIAEQKVKVLSLAFLCRNRVRHRVRYCCHGRTIRERLLVLPLPPVLLNFLTLSDIEEGS